MKQFLNMIGFSIILGMAGCTLASLSQNNMTGGGHSYDFRKSRWGDRIEKVEFSERGLTVLKRTEHLLVYRERIADVPVHIIYSFNKSKRLRAAGYIVDKPVMNARGIAKLAFKLHGDPTFGTSSGMEWKTKTSLIYCNIYPSVIQLPKHIFNGGALSFLFNKDPRTNVVSWNGVWGYVDLEFIEELKSKSFPIDHLFSYEKILLGTLRHRILFRFEGKSYPEL